MLEDTTSVQNHGAIDDVCGGYEGPLGCEIGGGDVTMRVWAPTARSVQLLVFDNPHGGDPKAVVHMHEGAGADTGVWSAQGSAAEWSGRWYQYAVEAYHPWGGGAPHTGAGGVVTSYTTDPYSRSLAADGERTHICDINSPDLKPVGWDTLQKPASRHSGSRAGFEPTDMAIYELHVRDFSALDESVPWELRGKYGAFAVEGGSGVRHLKALAESGLTHVHLLPTYDFG